MGRTKLWKWLFIAVIVVLAAGNLVIFFPSHSKAGNGDPPHLLITAT
ncbi:hypothetical protein [Heyndrickxia coagulans]|nr:hypothetical protein [Heyndrickxia coagulans]